MAWIMLLLTAAAETIVENCGWGMLEQMYTQADYLLSGECWMFNSCEEMAASLEAEISGCAGGGS